MELIGISEFIKDLEILRDLQRKMISILSCDESPISRSNQINELFIFFEVISISNNFSLYEAFLCILVHLSIYFDFHLTDEEIVSQRQEIFHIILKELIIKQSLKISFSQFTLFRIFKENKHLLLFLFEEEIFDLTFLKRYMSYVSDKDLFLFFILEIHKTNSQLYEKLKKSFNLTEIKIKQFYVYSKEKDIEEYSKTEGEHKQSTTFEIHRKIHSQDKIAKMIRLDDVHHFIEYTSKIYNFDFDSLIKPSFLEKNPDINNKGKGIGLLEYSMAFGSVNIFLYLWLKNIRYSKKSLKYCIIGNNFEIIHTVEEESIFTFTDYDKTSYKAIEYYHSEINEYFSNITYSNEGNYLDLSSIINIYLKTTNVDIFNEMLNSFCNNLISQVSPNNYISPFVINQILFKILNSRQYPLDFLCCFLIQQPNMDINSKNKAYLFIFMILFYF